MIFNFHTLKDNILVSLLAIMALSASIALTGCNKTEPVQTVEWYMAHDAERVAMRTKCHSNPGELGHTPNCINANQAEHQKGLSKRGGLFK